MNLKELIGRCDTFFMILSNDVKENVERKLPEKN